MNREDYLMAKISDLKEARQLFSDFMTQLDLYEINLRNQIAKDITNAKSVAEAIEMVKVIK